MLLKSFLHQQGLWLFLMAFLFFSCHEKNSNPSPELIKSMALKRGEIISCGPADQQFGEVQFETSCKEKQLFNLAVKLLHSFEYDEAEKVFAEIIDKEPGAAMAYWGIAMSNFHPLWSPPSEAELKKGARACELAQSIRDKTKREALYIDAIASFYKDWDKLDHSSRCLNFEKGMERVYKEYPGDIEAAVFYALSLDASADPSDKSFANQKKAGSILNSLYSKHPNHPGIVHYIIHTYDYPELAQMALPAAKRYAAVAPSSAHALHMPSHIFTRLGLWDECIQSNGESVSSAQCYAGQAGIKGHWDEELHGLDYLVYAYLQKGENDSAQKLLQYVDTMGEVEPVNFKVAYAFAAIPSRYVLENKLWKEASMLLLRPHFPWKKFPWQKAIVHFARGLGFAHTNKLNEANTELKELYRLHDTLANQKDSYKANQVQIQINTIAAWIKLKEGKGEEALRLMGEAADMEEKTEKHPVTPCEVLPATELLADMLKEMGQWDKALTAYEEDLKTHPNRFNGLYGAALVAEKLGNRQKATSYYQQLLSFVKNRSRPEFHEMHTALHSVGM
jgi:tetratricopeptide (TPR) repeat protein